MVSPVPEDGRLMSWIALIFALEFGMVPSEIHAEYWPDYDVLYRNQGLYGTLEARVELFNFLFVGGDIEAAMVGLSFDSYKPSGVSFNFEAGMFFGPVQVGYIHNCKHPAVSTYEVHWPWRQSSHDRVYVRIEGATK
jgi:hypothetical protein